MNVECCTIHKALKDLFAEHVQDFAPSARVARGERRRSKCQRYNVRRERGRGEEIRDAAHLRDARENGTLMTERRQRYERPSRGPAQRDN